MSQTEIEKLIRALDEWEVADDRANEATAAVGRSGALNAEKFEELRALERVATQKLEQVRSALAGEIEDNRLLNGRWYAGADAATGKGKLDRPARTSRVEPGAHGASKAHVRLADGAATDGFVPRSRSPASSRAQ